MSYYDVYRKRLNRFGIDFQSRVQGERERAFDDYLLKTVYRVSFNYDDTIQYGSLEKNKQDYTETQAYLLTKSDLSLANGTVLKITTGEGLEQYWMIWWLEQIAASGYNRYIVLKMTHYLSIEDSSNTISQWGYFYGSGTTAIKDTIKSKTDRAFYSENNNLHMFITPYSSALKKDGYFTVSYQTTTNGYVITDLDVNSTPGVAYVSVDPVPLRPQQTPVVITDQDDPADLYWLNGGK